LTVKPRPHSIDCGQTHSRAFARHFSDCHSAPATLSLSAVYCRGRPRLGTLACLLGNLIAIASDQNHQLSRHGVTHLLRQSTRRYCTIAPVLNVVEYVGRMEMPLQQPSKQYRGSGATALSCPNAADETEKMRVDINSGVLIYG